MAFKLEASSEGYTEQLDLFKEKPTEVGVRNTNWVEHRSNSQLGDTAALEFNIAGSSANYIDLKETRLLIRCKITKEDGNSLTQSDKVGLVNLPLQALWTQVEVWVNQNQVMQTAENYPYAAYIETLLKHDETSKQSQLQSQLYYKDNAGHFDETDVQSGMNFGLTERYQFTKLSKTVNLEGPLYTTIFSLDRYLLNGVALQIKLWPSKQPFRLMTGDATQSYKVVIEDAVLKICYVNISPGVLVAHGERLRTMPALYPYISTNVKSFSIASGQYAFNLEDFYNGAVPARLVVGLVSSKSYQGDYGKNPFNFQHYNLNYAAFMVDGRSVPARPLQPNYDNGDYTAAYLTLFSGYGKYNQNQGNDIQRYDYPNGNCLYVFDVDSSHEIDRLPLIKRGITRLELRFSRPLPETVTLITHADFPTIMQIDDARNVKL